MQSTLFGTSGAASNSTMCRISKDFLLTTAQTFVMYSLGSTTTGQLQGSVVQTEFFADNNYI